MQEWGRKKGGGQDARATGGPGILPGGRRKWQVDRLGRAARYGALGPMQEWGRKKGGGQDARGGGQDARATVVRASCPVSNGLP